jgi:hypothetical protein
VNRNVVDRDKGTPVWETNTRLGFSIVESLGTPVMVPDATDKAAAANRDTPTKTPRWVQMSTGTIGDPVSQRVRFG